MQVSINMFLASLPAVTFFLGNARAVPVDNALGDGGLRVQCGRLWTSIGLCRIGDTYYTLNSDYCTDVCHCGGDDGKSIICPAPLGACSGADVQNHCAKYHCVCE
jgi:hypothetical protein